VRETYCHGNTIFAWASGRYERVGKILLEPNDINPNSTNKYGETRLSRAAENGHKGVVRILLGKRNVNPNTADRYGQIPLPRARRNGQEGAVRIPPEQSDVNPDTTDKYGQWAWGSREDTSRTEQCQSRDS